MTSRAMIPRNEGRSRRAAPRSGVAVIWALVVLTVLGVVSATAIWQFTAARRVLEQRQSLVQALWLARSGAELAAARLMNDADGYTGETAELIPDADVRIAVKKESADGGYEIRCEVHYPASGPGSMAKLLVWKATRRTEPLSVRLELVEAEQRNE